MAILLVVKLDVSVNTNRKHMTSTSNDRPNTINFREAKCGALGDGFE
jgi:hypothetical protein